VVNLRIRLLVGADRLLAALLATVLVGTTLAFGGAVWWARPAVAALILLLVLVWLVRVLLEGTGRILTSPLPWLGGLALLLAAAQLVPLPARLAGTITPRDLALPVPGEPAPSEPAEGRRPATVDRPATLRWLVGAAGCLALFGVAAQFTDRLGHLLVIWGSVVAAFFLNTAIGLVQLLGGRSGLFGFLVPGEGPAWAPSLDDLLTTPGATVLRLADSAPGAGAPWALPRPDRPFSIGSLMGGPGAYLALGALGLPLALAIVLQLLAPRGSRDGLRDRLQHSGLTGLVALLVVLGVLGSGLAGFLAGAVLSVPLALGLLLTGLPAARPSGLRWSAVGLTVLTLTALAGGVVLGDLLGRPAGCDALATRAGWPETWSVWTDSARIAREFPVLGTGLGSFAAIYPAYKTQDAAPTTALSSLLQWWVEAGAVGLALLGLAGLWCLIRLPGAVRRVGSADRALACGLSGAAVGFALFSTLHWTVELPAVAVAASAVAGTWDRWLAGGTELFVERA
jgi:O-Antigen ligase